MKPHLLIARIVIMFAAVGALGLTNNADAKLRCQEDSPSRCWSWSTMGDHKRAVVTTDGQRRIVGPCGFTRLWDSARIDYFKTEPLRGDWNALEQGCRRA